MGEALRLGISRYQLYRMRDQGIIEPVSRGLYRLTELPPVSNPDLAVVASRFPNAVLCLISALAWHNLTTQIPHHVHLAVARQARIPRLDSPPVRGYRFSEPAFSAGIEEAMVDGELLRVYSVEKTLADCFKFRNRLGTDIVVEALQSYRRRDDFNPGKLMEFARICRVHRIIQPYMEALL